MSNPVVTQVDQDPESVDGQVQVAHENPVQEKEKKRGRSKRRDVSSDAATSALAEKFESMRVAIRDLLDSVDDAYRQMSVMDEKIRDDFCGILNREINPIKEKNEAIVASIVSLEERDNTRQAEIEAMKVEIQELKTELVLCKTTIANGVSANGTLAIHSAPKIDVPKPKEFRGERSAVAVEDFVWNMEQYFEAAGIHDEAVKVRTASLYCVGLGRMWWRFHVDEAKKGNQDPIETWEDFAEAMRTHFVPPTAVRDARSKLHHLEQKGSIHDYIKEFTELKLQIPNLGEEEALGAFMDGLKSWAQLELKRRDVQSLSKAISVAESLIDFGRGDSRSKGNGSRDRENDRKDSDSERGRKPYRDDRVGYKENRGREKWDEGTSNYKKSFRPEDEFKHPPSEPCRICKGNHWTQLCPKKNNVKVLSSVVAKEKEKGDDEIEGVARFATLAAIRHATPPKNQEKKKPTTLYFVEVKVRGKSLLALVDTGADGVYISAEAAHWLDLDLKPDCEQFKRPSQTVRHTYGIAKGVKAQIGEWKGKLDFEVIPLDDYDLVLGTNFFEQAQASVNMKTKTLVIDDPECPTSVVMINGIPKAKCINSICLMARERIESRYESPKSPIMPSKEKEVKWELPTTPSKRPIRSMSPKLARFVAANTKIESLMARETVPAPIKIEVPKPKKKRSRGRKNKNKTSAAHKKYAPAAAAAAAAKEKSPESRAPRTALDWVGELDTAQRFGCPSGRVLM